MPKPGRAAALVLASLVGAAPGELLSASPAGPARPTPSPGRAQLTGNWGGIGISLRVTPDGARLEFDCAHGEIRPPLETDESGRFRLEGSYTQERPGPTRQGDESRGIPAVYSGSADETSMSLTVSLRDPDSSLGPYALKRDAPPRLRRCQ